MIFGSVCSGIEAASVAFSPLGWRAAWLSEIEPFPSAVLANHYPEVPNLGDMTRLPAAVLTGEADAPDVLCGGTPCQAFSVAGMREGLNDPRGQLTIKFVELADAIDHVRTRAGKPECITIWENVPGVLSDRGNAFGCFLGALAGEDCELQPPGGKWKDAGCVYGPKRTIAWRVLDAQYFGLAQRRRRVFVVASARNDFDPCAVLFESDSLRRDTAPSREARQVSPTIPARSTAGGGLGTDFDLDGGVIQAFGGNNQSGPIDVATTRNACASASGRMDFETETFLVQPTHTLRGEGFDASEDGAGRGTPLVPTFYSIMPMNSGRDYKAREVEVAQPLMAGGPVGGNQGGDVILQPVAFPANLSGTQYASTENLSPALGAVNPTAVAFSCKDHGADASNDIAPTMRAMGHAGSHPNAGGQLAVAIQDVRGTDKAQNGRGWNDDGTAYTLDTHATQGVAICGAFFAGQGAKAGSIAYSTDVAPTLKASDSGTNRTPSVHINTHPAVAFTTEQTPKFSDDCALTLTKQSPTGGGQIQSVMSAMQVRRLTPVECERLMGFPDGYTAIPWRNKPASECPDGPRYKALGNSWAVPVAAWIARRIHRQIAT